MKSVVSKPSIAIPCTSTKHGQDSVAGDTSSSMAGWGELPFPESDLELSMTKIDVFSDYPFDRRFGAGSAFTFSSLPVFPFQPDAFTYPVPFQDDLDLSLTLGRASTSAAPPPGPPQSAFPFQPDAFTRPFPFPDDLDLSLALERTSMSATSPSDPPQSYTGNVEREVRGRHFPVTSPNRSNGRSRSIARGPRVASAQLRRVVSSDHLTLPRSLDRREALGGAVLPHSGKPSYGDGHAHFTQHNIYNFGHDQPSSDPDHNYPSSSRPSPVTDGGGHGEGFFDSQGFWDCGGASRPGSTSMLTGDNRLHPSYYDWCSIDPNCTSGPDTLINPNPVPLGSDGAGDDRDVSLATGTTSPQPQDRDSITEEVLSASSMKPSGFRASVGTNAMVEACRKRRKKKDGVRLFVCTVSGCNRNFTARHNLRYHHKSHNNIRNEICRHCEAGFVTRETLRRHLKTCDGIKKRNR